MMKNLRLLGLLVIAAHGFVDIWHLLLTPKVLPVGTSPHLSLIFGFVAAIHLAIAVSWWFLPRRFAGPLLFVLLIVAFVFGGYEHFLSSGLNNMFHVPAVDGATAFRLSAIFLPILELLGCAVALTGTRSVA